MQKESDYNTIARTAGSYVGHCATGYSALSLIERIFAAGSPNVAWTCNSHRHAVDECAGNVV